MAECEADASGNEPAQYSTAGGGSEIEAESDGPNIAAAEGHQGPSRATDLDPQHFMDDSPSISAATNNFFAAKLAEGMSTAGTLQACARAMLQRITAFEMLDAPHWGASQGCQLRAGGVRPPCGPSASRFLPTPHCICRRSDGGYPPTDPLAERELSHLRCEPPAGRADRFVPARRAGHCPGPPGAVQRP
jgi:hypothetical protein